MLNSFKFSLPDAINDRYEETIAECRESKLVERIWAKDATVWTGDDESKWLGWLNVVDSELASLDKYSELADHGFDDVLLMGMGGSSLCPEVLSFTFGKTRFHILDSTVPAQVRAVEEKLDLTRTLFIVASKSGSTLEPNCFKQYFFDKVAALVGKQHAGKQFIAITDPGSKMEQVAKDDGFRDIFYGDPEIGGRFSALSTFGMTAAASMGVDIEKFLTNANEMVAACRTSKANPGEVLGKILGVCHELGRDKLTIFTTDAIHDVGAWLEQLIAESTGKIGVSIIPVDRESVQHASHYGDDRIFAFLSLKGDTSFDDAFAELSASHPAIRIELDSIDTLGQEFFRWEFATAVAGSIMQINPFNQPDVEAAKIEARKITDEYEKTGSLPAETPFIEDEGFSLFSSDKYAAELRGSSLGTNLRDILDTHLMQLLSGDYFAVLAYVQMNSETEKLLQAIRERIFDRTGAATCLGFGPRFLHSTGQAYKGGANNGVFLQITSDDAFDIPVPGQKYTFGVVKSAQARGDFQVLLDRGRRALRIHLGSDVLAGLKKILNYV